METTTDYKLWLDELGLETADEHNDLYNTIRGTDSGYGYEINQNASGNYVVTADTLDLKLLLTEKAKNAFLTHLNAMYGYNIDGAAAFERGMAKND